MIKKLSLSEKMVGFRAYRPCEWLMNEFILDAELLELEIDQLNARVEELEQAVSGMSTHSNEWSDYACGMCLGLDGEHSDDCNIGHLLNRTNQEPLIARDTKAMHYEYADESSCEFCAPDEGPVESTYAEDNQIEKWLSDRNLMVVEDTILNRWATSSTDNQEALLRVVLEEMDKVAVPKKANDKIIAVAMSISGRNFEENGVSRPLWKCSSNFRQRILYEVMVEAAQDETGVY